MDYSDFTLSENIKMKKTIKKFRGAVICAGLALATVLSGCGKKSEETDSSLPSGFNKKSDTEKVAYMMRTASPDSVARFVMNASLGKIKGVQLDSLAQVELYIVSNYDSQKQLQYAEESVRLQDQLTLAQRMQLFKKGSADDPIGFGLDLGLGYLSIIREKNLSAKDVEKEIKEFQKECKEDTATYRRFVIGFTEALRQDKDKDVKKEIYDRFINLDRN